MTVLAGRGELWGCNLRCTLWERTFKTAICSAVFQPFCAFREAPLHQRVSRQRKKGKRLREKEREGRLGEGCMGFEGMCAVLGALWTPKCLLQATGPSSLSLCLFTWLSRSLFSGPKRTEGWGLCKQHRSIINHSAGASSLDWDLLSWRNSPSHAETRSHAQAPVLKVKRQNGC